VVRRVEWSKGEVVPAYRDRRGQMPNALRIGLLGPLRLQDTAGRVVPVGGRQLRILLTLLALNAGRVVPAASMAEQICHGASGRAAGTTAGSPDGSAAGSSRADGRAAS
jgi:hypothetical protein